MVLQCAPVLHLPAYAPLEGTSEDENAKGSRHRATCVWYHHDHLHDRTDHPCTGQTRRRSASKDGWLSGVSVSEEEGLLDIIGDTEMREARSKGEREHGNSNQTSEEGF